MGCGVGDVGGFGGGDVKGAPGAWMVGFMPHESVGVSRSELVFDTPTRNT